jgi:hypothetical protein
VQLLKRLGAAARGPAGARYGKAHAGTSAQTHAPRLVLLSRSAAAKTPEKAAATAALLRATELADRIMQRGFLSVYEATREKLGGTLSQAHGPGGTPAETATSSDTVAAAEVEADDEDVVMWQYRLVDADDAELFGPFSNSQMMAWQEQVRKVLERICESADSACVSRATFRRTRCGCDRSARTRSTP